jgi:hypothetical protein
VRDAACPLSTRGGAPGLEAEAEVLHPALEPRLQVLPRRARPTTCTRNAQVGRGAGARGALPAWAGGRRPVRPLKFPRAQTSAASKLWLPIVKACVFRGSEDGMEIGGRSAGWASGAWARGGAADLLALGVDEVREAARLEHNQLRATSRSATLRSSAALHVPPHRARGDSMHHHPPRLNAGGAHLGVGVAVEEVDRAERERPTEVHRQHQHRPGRALRGAAGHMTLSQKLPGACLEDCRKLSGRGFRVGAGARLAQDSRAPPCAEMRAAAAAEGAGGRSWAGGAAGLENDALHVLERLGLFDVLRRDRRAIRIDGCAGTLPSQNEFTCSPQPSPPRGRARALPAWRCRAESATSQSTARRRAPS